MLVLKLYLPCKSKHANLKIGYDKGRRKACEYGYSTTNGGVVGTGFIISGFYDISQDKTEEKNNEKK
jgi:hypothetical protein